MTEYIRKDAIVLNKLNIYNKALGITMKQKEWIVDENAETITIVKCKDCIHADSPALTDSLATENEVYCEVLGQLRMMDWFCANGRERKND